MDPSEVKKKISDALKEARVEVSNIHHPDEKSEGGHFEIKVISPEFRDKNTVERHRVIHQILGDEIGGDIHAVEITAETPGEN